jgi:hypothetical protein
MKRNGISIFGVVIAVWLGIQFWGDPGVPWWLPPFVVSAALLLFVAGAARSAGLLR